MGYLEKLGDEMPGRTLHTSLSIIIFNRGIEVCFLRVCKIRRVCVLQCLNLSEVWCSAILLPLFVVVRISLYL